MVTGIKDTVRPVDAPSVLGLFPSPPRLLALGEPTHGEDTLLEMRNAVFRQLVEEAGYRTVAIESDCLRGLVVDDYVTSGAGTLDEAMERGFSHGLGASAANRELVRWMRAHNDGLPPAEQVRFAGFDGPLEITGAASPRQALTALHTYLADRIGPGLLPCTAQDLDRLLGDDGRWTELDAMLNPARSVGRTAGAGRLRLLADDLVSLLDEQAPALLAANSPYDRDDRAARDGRAARAEWDRRDAWERARLYGRTATGLLLYHSWMADTSEARMDRLLGLRDRMMAGNLLALAARGPVLVHAHNAHLQRRRSTMRMWQGDVRWWSAGALVGARLGEEYGFLATALGTIRHQGVDTPPPDTLEGLLYALPQESCLVEPRRLAAALGAPPPAPRVSPWFGYAALDPDHLADVDGVVFVKDMPEPA
ncbi:erythromycin esterase family protein [Streptomyces sp. enrichment culture]|uniref:erythromycin esterase family protein n=1 Tax=Streptomyces sp. enrichment culture TaxID=1795815 RepID=UPI003F54D5E7